MGAKFSKMIFGDRPSQKVGSNTNRKSNTPNLSKDRGSKSLNNRRYAGVSGTRLEPEQYSPEGLARASSAQTQYSQASPARASSSTITLQASFRSAPRESPYLASMKSRLISPEES